MALNHVCLFVLILMVLNFLSTTEGGVQFQLEPDDKIVASGTTVWWHCRAHNPVTTVTITYRWRFMSLPLMTDERQYVLPNGTLVLSRLSANQTGIYQCLADDGVSQGFSRRASLSLAYLAPTFSLHPQTQYASPSQSVRLSCAIPSAPPAIISWQWDGRPLLPAAVSLSNPGEAPGGGEGDERKSLLTVEGVTASTVGLYRCVALNPVLGETRYSQAAGVYLEGKPHFSVEPQPVSAIAGQVARLSCEAGGFPPPTVRWFDMRRSSIETPIQNVSTKYVVTYTSLTVLALREEDAGFYTCRATNPLGQVSKTVLLTVLDESEVPRFTSIPQDTVAFEGEAVSWTCAATGQPPPLISWAKEDGALPEERLEMPYPGALRLLDVGLEDAGRYLCRAASPSYVSNHSWTLTIQAGPAFLTGPQDQAVIEGRPARLTCRTSGQPSPALTWILPSQAVIPVPGSSKAHDVITWENGSLSIGHVTQAHAGRYACVARNAVGVRTASAVLHVYTAPYFTVVPSDTSILEGAPVTLHCAGAGFPEPRVTWFGPPSNVTLRTTETLVLYPNGTLQLWSVTRGQQGKYTCVLSNEVLQVASVVELSVLVPPTFQSQPIDAVIEQGSTVAIDCLASGSPNPTTRWQHEEKRALVPSANMDLLGNGTLIIRGLRADQFGVYVCEASSTAGRRVQISYLRQHDLPLFLVSPSNITANATSTTHFRCEATAHEHPSLRWYRAEGQETAGGPPASSVMEVSLSSRTFITDMGDFVIQEVKALDEGWYACVATNSYGSVTKWAFLDVKVPPHIVVPAKSVRVAANSSVTLHCLTTADPPAVMSWRPPRRADVISASTSTYVLEGDTLYIVGAAVGRDAGQWRCGACNYLGCEHSHVTLQVEGAATLVEAVGKAIGNLTRVRCIAEGLPIPEVTYMWRALLMTDQNTDTGGSMRISDDGWLELVGPVRPPYGCQAANMYGTDSRILDAPSTPPQLVVTEETNTSAQVSWLMAPRSSLLPPASFTLRLSTPAFPARPPRDLSFTTDGDTIAAGGMSRLLEDLQPYTTYEVMVAAVNVLGQSEFTQSVQFTTRAGVPSGAREVQVTFVDGVLTVTWKHPLNINGDAGDLVYEVDYTNWPDGTTVTARHNDSRPMAVHFPGARYGDTVDVTVTTINVAEGLRGPSSRLILVLNNEAPVSAPSHMKATVMPPASIKVQWERPRSEPTIAGYMVVVSKTSESDHTAFRIDDQLARAYIVDGVLPGAEYVVKVAAYNHGGVGPYSAAVVIRIPPSGGGLIEPATGGGRRAAANRQTVVIGAVAGSVAALFLVLLALVAACCYQRHRRQLLERDIDTIYSQNQESSHDKHFACMVDSDKSVPNYYDDHLVATSSRGRGHSDKRQSSRHQVSSIGTADRTWLLRRPPDVVLVSHQEAQDELPLPSTADYELAEVTYGESSMSSSRTGTGASTVNMTDSQSDAAVYATIRPSRERAGRRRKREGNSQRWHSVVSQSTPSLSSFSSSQAPYPSQSPLVTARSTTASTECLQMAHDTSTETLESQLIILETDSSSSGHSGRPAETAGDPRFVSGREHAACQVRDHSGMVARRLSFISSGRQGSDREGGTGNGGVQVSHSRNGSGNVKETGSCSGERHVGVQRSGFSPDITFWQSPPGGLTSGDLDATLL